jgi:hypothetical protein
VRPTHPRRRLALVGLCAALLAAACGFPSVTFTDAGADGATREEEASSDATNGEGSVGLETGVGDEGSVVDAGLDVFNPVDAADAIAPQDSGQDVSSVPEAAADTGPRMDATSDGPNCNCGAGSMLPTNLTCTGLLGLGCTGQGFVGSGPVCGASGTYSKCATSGLSCVAQSNGTKVQECQ